MGGPVRKRGTIVQTNSKKIDLIPGLIVFAGRPLACIAHKSSEICERCRLRQQNSPASPKNSAVFFRE